MITFSDAIENGLQGVPGIAEIEDEHLVLASVDELSKLAAKCRQLLVRKFAEEHAELGVISVRQERAEDPVASFIIADVVAEEVLASGHQRVTMLW
jgi:hypothetical protein